MNCPINMHQICWIKCGSTLPTLNFKMKKKIYAPGTKMREYKKSLWEGGKGAIICLHSFIPGVIIIIIIMWSSQMFAHGS